MSVVVLHIIDCYARCVCVCVYKSAAEKAKPKNKSTHFDDKIEIDSFSLGAAGEGHRSRTIYLLFRWRVVDVKPKRQVNRTKEYSAIKINVGTRNKSCSICILTSAHFVDCSLLCCKTVKTLIEPMNASTIQGRRKSSIAPI